jgi:CDP-paratose 2-epimerase
MAKTKIKYMNVAVIKGSSGLIVSQSVRFSNKKLDLVVGIDNKQRAYFFGSNASTENTKIKLTETIVNFELFGADIFEQIIDRFKD